MKPTSAIIRRTKNPLNKILKLSENKLEKGISGNGTNKLWSEANTDLDFLNQGHYACPGCGAVPAMRYALKALGKNTIVVIPACCWSVIEGPFPMHCLKVTVYHTAFETAAIMAAGIKAGLDMQGKNNINIMAFAGDGGTADIGIQALSGACERNDDIIYACYDNEAYMNTGIQRSSSTPLYAWTTTTPAKTPKAEPKKNMVEIIAAHRVPYAATCSIAFPEDMIAKFKKARTIRGLKYLHIYAPCPTGWKMEPELMIKSARLASDTCIFPIYEVENGIKYKINYFPKQKLSVHNYYSIQKRFSHLKKKEIDDAQKRVDFEWNLLKERAGKLCSHS